MAAGRPVAQVRVKRCGKSAPAPGVTRVARQTPPGARPDRGSAARTPTPPGGPLEPAGNCRPRGMAAGGRSRVRNRIRRIGRLTTTSLRSKDRQRVSAVVPVLSRQRCAEHRTRRAVAVRHQVGGGVQRLDRAGVSESVLQRLHALATSEHHRGVCVSQLMEPGTGRESGCSDRSRPHSAGEVGPPYRLAALVGEHELVFARTERIEVSLQRFLHGGRQRHTSDCRCRLARSEPRLAVRHGEQYSIPGVGRSRAR
jgi:hypothetical protein